MPPQNNPSKREYPAFYEKAIPIAIGLLAIVIVAMLVFTILVAVGALNFS